jgi:hypothetical protein
MKHDTLPRLSVISLCLLLFATATTLLAQEHPADKSGVLDKETVTAMQQEKVLLPVRWDATKGSLFLGVPLTEKAGTTSPQYILNDSLPYGVGQNDLGMDRGQISVSQVLSLSSGPRLVHFEKVGPQAAADSGKHSVPHRFH